MKIGILQTDSVREEFQAEFGDYPDMFQSMLTKAATSPVEFSVYDVEHHHYPSSIDECDAYLITGSRYSAYEDFEWIAQLSNYIVELNDAKKKLVGICFGHQIIARALGGEAELAAVGWGVGVYSSEIVRDKTYMNPPLPAFAALVSHRDQVTRLPDGAQLLASNVFCPNAMYQIDNHILSFQGHPEFHPDYASALMVLRKDLLGKEIYSKGQASLGQSLDSHTLAQWILGFYAG